MTGYAGRQGGRADSESTLLSMPRIAVSANSARRRQESNPGLPVTPTTRGRLSAGGLMVFLSRR